MAYYIKKGSSPKQEPPKKPSKGRKLFLQLLGGVIVSERIMPGAVYQDHGARVDPVVVGERGLDRGGANNLICPTATTSKNAVGEATNGYLVNVEKVDVFELARRYPEAFGRDYDPADGLRVSAWMAEGE